MKQRRELLSVIANLTRHFEFTNYRIIRLFSKKNAVILVRGERRSQALTDIRIDSMVHGVKYRPIGRCHSCGGDYATEQPPGPAA